MNILYYQGQKFSDPFQVLIVSDYYDLSIFDLTAKNLVILEQFEKYLEYLKTLKTRLKSLTLYNYEGKYWEELNQLNIEEIYLHFTELKLNLISNKKIDYKIIIDQYELNNLKYIKLEKGIVYLGKKIYKEKEYRKLYWKNILENLKEEEIDQIIFNINLYHDEIGLEMLYEKFRKSEIIKKLL